MNVTSKAPKPYKENRPWGDFTEFSKNQPSTVKIITVNAGESLSSQSHKKRDEFWRILSGSGFVTIGDKRVPAKKGDEFFVTRETKHRIEGGATGPLEVLEISFGEFEESDIIRYEDRYGRV